MGEKQVLVLGAGISGLANAAMLAKKGFKVRVLEKHAIPGGVARCVKDKGFHFDMGPSWYLMPEIFEKYFAFFGKKPGDYFKLIELDPSYRIFFEGDRTVTIHKSMEKNAALFESLEKDGAKKLSRYLADSKFKYDAAVREFLYRDYLSPLDFLNWNIMKHGVRLGLLKKLDGYAKKYFSDHRSRKIVEFNTVFLGSSPFTVPALYSLMSYVDLELGVFYPMGGMYELPKALHALCLEQGVEFQFNVNVEGIRVRKGRATGAVTSAGFIEGDAVLSSLDYHHADTVLLPKGYRNYSDLYWNSRVMGPSALLLFLGLNKKVDAVTHHSFFLAHRWERHFDAIFDHKRWPENPCYYISCPSKTDPSVAPPGKDLLFVLVPLASGLDDTEKIRHAFTQKILTHMEGVLGTNLRDSIETMYTVSHRDFMQSGNLFKGTALGLAHTLLQTAILRPSHKHKLIPNLYFAGSYTQPGIGMPMVLIGAHLVSDLMEKSEGKSRTVRR